MLRRALSYRRRADPQSELAAMAKDGGGYLHKRKPQASSRWLLRYCVIKRDTTTGVPHLYYYTSFDKRQACLM